MSEYHLSPFPSHPNYLGNLTLDQANAYYELSKFLALRRALPVRQLQLLELNQNGGRLDETDPKYAPWEAKQKKYSRDEPRRFPYSITDVLMPYERYEPMLEIFSSANSSDNPFAEVPMAILLEIDEALKARTLPNWFYATIGVDKLRAAIGDTASDHLE